MKLEQIPPEDDKKCDFRDDFGRCDMPVTGKQRLSQSFPWSYVCEGHFMLGMIAGIEQQNFNEKLRVKPFEQIMGEGVAPPKDSHETT